MRTQQTHQLPMCHTLQQTIHQLITPNPQPWVLRGEFCDASFLSHLAEHDDVANTWHHLLLRLTIASYCHETGATSALLARMQPITPSFNGSVMALQYVFYTGLNLCSAPRTLQQQKQINECIEQMRHFKALQSDNLTSKLALFEAEWAANHRRFGEAEMSYQLAIDSASHSRRWHECGMAQLYYGHYLLQRGHFHSARKMLHAAMASYRRWGANALAEHIEHRFGTFLLGRNTPHR